LRPATPSAPSELHESVTASPVGPVSAPGIPSDGGPLAGAAWVNPNLAALIGTEPSLPALQRSSPAAAAAAISAAGPATVQTSRREPQMTLARPQSAAQAPTSAPFDAPISYAAGSGQVPGIVATPGAPTTVQMTPAQALQTPVLAPTATAVVQRQDASPAPAPAPDGGGLPTSAGDLDALARALFPKFQRQLRMEYVYEREARGLPYDR
jgi:hypothetical protein